MSWGNGQWYRCTVAEIDYIKSPEKGTPGFEVVCRSDDHGEITGVWWLSDTITKGGVPMWQAVMDRLLKLGCTDEGLRSPGWVEHVRERVVGADVSVCVEVDKYGPKAAFIGVPKSSTGFAKSTEAQPSLFAAKLAGKSAGGDPFAAAPADDDLPF